jgi:Leucine-rich repeat (LRR) protein
MENKTKIGIGVLALAGVGYYFYNKSKSSMTNVTTTNVGQPNKTGFDREKASKELAVLFFSLMNKKVMQPQTTAVVTDVKTGLQMAVPTREQVLSQSLSNYRANLKPITELTLYNKFLLGLNGILDDSDAEFLVNTYKKYAQAGGDRNFKPDLDTQIRIDKIQKKYPNALKELELG